MIQKIQQIQNDREESKLQKLTQQANKANKETIYLKKLAEAEKARYEAKVELDKIRAPMIQARKERVEQYQNILTEIFKVFGKIITEIFKMLGAAFMGMYKAVNKEKTDGIQKKSIQS